MNLAITIINDSKDANAVGRQETRVTSLLGSPVTFVGVSSDLEASGNLIDALDAIEEREGVVLLNLAPRNRQTDKWANGAPFGYFWYKKILVIATIDGFTLSLVKKLQLVDCVNVLEISSSLDRLIENGDIPKDLKEYIVDTQFRSFDFVPRIAKFLLEHKDTQSTPLYISEVFSAPPAVWWVDNFGNCKTTVLPEEISFKANNRVLTKLGELPFYSRLKDVPDKTAALIIGSSGLGTKRFLEVVIQGGSAAEHFNLSSGSLIL